MKYIIKFSFIGSIAVVSFAAIVAFSPDATAAELSASESSLTFGTGVGIGPDYLGSKKNKTVPMLLLDYQHRSGLFASTQRGIGWGGESKAFEYSLAVNGRAERTDQDHKSLSFKSGSSELLGMGTVKSSAVAQGNITYRLGDSARIHVNFEAPLTHRDNGSTVQLGGEYTVWHSVANSVELNGSMDVADGKYMRTYFGVSATQSAASGYAIYAPKSGLYKVELSVGWTHRIDQHWRVVTVAGLERLTGDAGKSPISLRKNAPQGGVMVSYSY
ncbi:MipA/OmpV family protein [Roseateles cellulosilyticus]|uniref:MipA/OmpV family protein n=1 Tax=Pelomonas cellulosilytica TaxID=2906762 RepID=A0ABS8Y1G0_9BURK|nr:MipA/OmpV family protein [Pelomonas sp. P8]MCE4556859.1 MipA/OmpV family protein [Pelomonas sp. P8]